VPHVAGSVSGSGELVAFAEDLTLHVWPADGAAKPKVTRWPPTKSKRLETGTLARCRFAAAYTAQRRRRLGCVWQEPVEYLSRDVGDVTYQLRFSPTGTWLAVLATLPRGQGTLLLCNLPTKAWTNSLSPDDMPNRFRSHSTEVVAIAVRPDVQVIDTSHKKERSGPRSRKHARPSRP